MTKKELKLKNTNKPVKKRSNEIASALFLITNEFSRKLERDLAVKMGKDLWKSGFELRSPDGNKKVGSKSIQHCIWRVMSKYQFLDFQLHSSTMDQQSERIATEGLSTVMENGGFIKTFRDKGGIFMNQFLEGDGFVWIGTEDDKEINKAAPLAYKVVKLEDIYYEANTNGIRGTKPSKKLAVIQQYSREEAYSIWPELKRNGIMGRIPGSYQKDERETELEVQGIVEVCWYYNLISKSLTVFAGSNCYELNVYSGKVYPFRKKGRCYIPIFQFICIATDEGFTNHSVIDMVYDLAVVTAKMLNLELSHAEDMVYPLTVFNTPGGKADELIQKMAMAYKARDVGKKPIIAMDFGSNGGNSVQSQSLISQNLLNEWQIVWDTLAREFSRLGIYIDDVDRGTGYTATQVYAEEDASNAFTKMIGEFNASETKELIECTIQAIIDNVSETNRTPINMTTVIEFDDGTKSKLKEGITLGNLAKEFKDGNYFVIVNSKSGSVPSNTMEYAKLERLISMTVPGSAEMQLLYKQHAALDGIDLKIPQPVQTQAEPQAEATVGGQGQPIKPGNPIQTETERGTVPAYGQRSQAIRALNK